MYLSLEKMLFLGIKSDEKKSSVQKDPTCPTRVLVSVVWGSIEDARTMWLVPGHLLPGGDVSPQNHLVLPFPLFSVQSKFSWVPRRQEELLQSLYGLSRQPPFK